MDIFKRATRTKNYLPPSVFEIFFHELLKKIKNCTDIKKLEYQNTIMEVLIERALNNSK